MKKNTQKTYITLSLLGALAVPFVGMASASAADVGNASTTGTHIKSNIHKQAKLSGIKSGGVMGTITSINGTTLTVTNKAGVVYTINATTGTVKNNGVASTLSALAVGNTVAVRGTVTGTSIVATSIDAGTMKKSDRNWNETKGKAKGVTPGAIAYKPMISGTVTGINGNVLTVTGTNSTVYMVDATTAKVMKSVIGSKPVAGTIASILNGDSVRVQGTLTGTNMTATNILDGILPQKSATKTPRLHSSATARTQ